MATAVGTIAAKRELPYARVLARSLREHHPELPFFVLLADEVQGCFDPAAEPYRLVPFDDLDLPGSPRMRFVHTRLELSYAATPSFLAWLLDAGYDSAVFIKQESLVLGELRAMLGAVETSAIVLTPHLFGPVDGADGVARELNILLSGVFNGGTLAVREGAEARAFLAWWADRVAHGCRHAVAEGLHYEQRWLDLVPAYFGGARILRDPAANVGHWNLPDNRDVAPAMLRFSGFEPEHPDRVTRYSDRVALESLGPLAEHFAAYAHALLDAGWDEARTWPYAFDRFENGISIPQLARDLWRVAGAPENPFAYDFYRWLNEPARPPARVSRLWHEVYRRRPDVQAAFPEPFGADEERFLNWTASSGLAEHGVDEHFLVGT